MWFTKGYQQHRCVDKLLECHLKSPCGEIHLNVPILSNSISLNAWVHFVLILESRNATQDISKLGVCHPVAGAQQQAQRENVQGCRENKG